MFAMATLDLDKEDSLLQQQPCDLGKVKLEPPDFYNSLDYDEMGFMDWDVEYIDISSSNDGSGKSILGAEIGEEVASISAHMQSHNSLPDFSVNGINHRPQQQMNSEQLPNYSQLASRMSQPYAASPESTELPPDFLEPFLSERDIGSPLFILPPLQPSSNGTSSIYRPSSKQFWKAGDYESDFIREKVAVGGMDHVRVHPKFLHSNATSHKWALGAVAELLDNALDEAVNGATFVNLDMIRNPRDGSAMLLIEDDGGGMNPDCMRQCMSLGYSAKSKIANTIGQYGNGFKTSTMRLGADVIVFSLSPGRDGCSATKSIGLLSYSFLTGTCQEDIMVPMVDYEIQPFGLRKLIRRNAEDWNNNMEIIKQWSPYSFEIDLLEHFKGMKQQGTRIVVYNLWENDQGQLELDFDADPHDIQVRGANRDERNILLAKRLPNSRHYLTYKHSLRSYASILYLRLPKNYKIILRGKRVEHHNLVEDLMFIQEVTYRPQVGPEHTVKETSQMKAIVTIGFVKDAREHLDVQGFNVYHKNRLIKPFWRIWNSAASRGRGIIGVLEANFVEPAHDKQGFERTIVLARLEARLLEMQKTYWSKHCHRVGYVNSSLKKGKHSFSDGRNTESANPGSPLRRSQTELPVSSIASSSISLLSQSHGVPSQACEQCELPVRCSSLTVTSCMQPQTHIIHLEPRREMGNQVPSISLAFSGTLHTQVQETVSTTLQAPLPNTSIRSMQETASGSLQVPSGPMVLARPPQASSFTRMPTNSSRCQIQEELFSTLQERSEAEVPLLHFPSSSAMPFHLPLSEVRQVPQPTRLEPEVNTSHSFPSVTRSIEFPAEKTVKDPSQARTHLDEPSLVVRRSVHPEVHEVESESSSALAIPVVVPRGMRSQIQHVPARAHLTDAVSLTVSTMQDTAVAPSNRSNLREKSTALRTPPSTMQESTVASFRTTPREKLNVSRVPANTMREATMSSFRTAPRENLNASRTPSNAMRETNGPSFKTMLKEKLNVQSAPVSTMQETAIASLETTSRENLTPVETPPSTVQEKVVFSLRILPMEETVVRTSASTVEETAVAPLGMTPREELIAMKTPVTKPAAVEVDGLLSMSEFSESSDLQEKIPVIKRKSLEELGRMFAKQLVTAERKWSTVDPAGATNGTMASDKNPQTEAATGTSEQQYEGNGVVERALQEVTNMVTGNSNDCNAQAQNLASEAEKNRQLQACLLVLEDELQILERNISNLVSERDSLKVQLEEERMKDAESQQFQIKLQDALMQIRELEAENSRLRSAHQ